MFQVAGMLWFWASLFIAVAGILGVLYTVDFGMEKRKSAFFAWAFLCLLVSGAAGISNPVVQLVLFHRWSNRRASAMHEQFRGLVGTPVASLPSEYREPDRRVPTEGGEIWYYSPTPWYVQDWTELAVHVEEGAVKGAYLDD